MNALDQGQRTNIRHGGLDTFFNASAHLVAGLAVSVRKTSSPLSQSDYDWAQRVLSALPLGTDEYQIASQRLQNGWQYHLAGEVGAAAYELTQISNRLKREVIHKARLRPDG